MPDWLDNPIYPTVLPPRMNTSIDDARKAGFLGNSLSQFSQVRTGDLSVSTGAYGGVSQAEANRMPLISSRLLNNTTLGESTNNQLFNSLAYALFVNTTAYASMVYRNSMSLITVQQTAAVSAYTAQYNEIVRDATAAGNNDAISLIHNEYAAINLSAGTITNMYMTLNEASWGGTSAEVVTNFYGWYMEDLTSYVTAGRITNLWNIYTAAGNSRLSGIVFVNDTTNANMTQGLTLNQGATSDEIISLKSSDVAHGMTSRTETDTYLSVIKMSDTAGGCQIRGYSEANIGLALEGNSTSDDTAKSTSGYAPIRMASFLKSGTGITSPGANANLFVIGIGAGATKFIFDAEGDSHEDGTGWTAYDDRDDVEVLDSINDELIRSKNPNAPGLPPQSQKYGRAFIQKERIVSFNDGPGEDGVPFINKSRLMMLVVGALRQERGKRVALEGRLRALEVRP